MFVWSKLSSVKWNDAWEERFYGNTNAVIEEIKGGKSIRIEVYCKSQEEAEEIKDQFGGSVREIKSATWEEPQTLIHKPILIRDKIVLTQTLEEDVLEDLRNEYPAREIINIPAEMAFGTGDHPTTSTCLRFLCDVSAELDSEWSCIDIGCGTGLIAIAAHRLGAAKVEAYDFDEKAVEVTQKNLLKNDASAVNAFVDDVFKWEATQKYDVVAANLFSTILQKAFPVFKGCLKPDGKLIISGILQTQWEDTEKAARQYGFSVLEKRGKGKWMSALLRV